MALVCPACRTALEGARCERCARWLVARAALDRGDGDPLLGATLLDRFGILGARAFGAFATVYDAVDAERGEPCVVKVVRGAGAAASDLAREAALLSRAPARVAPRVRGHGAARLAGAADPEEVTALAMDLAPGETVAALAAAGSLGPERAWTLAAALLGAVAELHDAGLVHGDLKPDHALVDGEATVRLVDFGSAAEIGATGPAGQGFSPSFAPPEQRERGPGVSADLFAWARVVESCLGAAAAVDPARGAKLAGALAWALAEDPSERPAHARTLLAATTG